MGLSKQQKTKVIINVSLAFLFLIGILIALYYIFLSFKFDQSYFILIAMIIVCSASIGCYIGIRNLSIGKDIFSGLELVWKDRDDKLIFWLLSPLLFFIFANIYMIPVVFFIWLISVSLGSAGGQHADLISYISLGICLLCAFITMLWLWRSEKLIFRKNNKERITSASKTTP